MSYKTIKYFYDQKEEYNEPKHSLNIKWEKKEYKNSAEPEVWGPSFWLSLHIGSVNYPNEASPLCKEGMKGFILGMPYMIPCKVCSEHARAHIEANYEKLDDIVSGKIKLFNFFVDFHNKVNKRYGKPLWTYEDAYKLYTNGANVSKITY